MIKIERNPTAPASLAIEAKKKYGSYREKDVLQQLAVDFHDKCYICEIKPVQDPEVEHRLPHKNRSIPERVFDWNNLFYSCGHCNSIKNDRRFDDGIIDCCVRDPEELLVLRLEENHVHVIVKNETDTEAMRTAELIEEVFNSTSTGIRTEASQVRLKELQQVMNAFFVQLDQYRNNTADKRTIQTIRAFMKREYAFAGFIRSYVRETGYLQELFVE